MAGKVFISCGQRPPSETAIARQVADLLRKEFGLTPYLAFRVQSLDDIMTITDELCSSDYYLFIDFRRDAIGQSLPCSLFTHQELALAHHIRFEHMVALQQEETPLEGFLKYILSNPERFTDEEDLLKKIRRLVKERRWTPDYSRNLVVTELTFTPPLQYCDHTGASLQLVWQARVENRRSDVAAVDTVCILDYVQGPDQSKVPPFDRAYLKWAGQAGYQRTILPKDFGVVDLFAMRADTPGLFLHSLRDTSREPILTNDGHYDLAFKLFSKGFPLLEFQVRVELQWSPPTEMPWQPNTRGELLR
jgi:hypothetical protein